MSDSGRLNRKTQLELLQDMEKVYPRPATRFGGRRMDDACLPDLSYLEELGLCVVDAKHDLGGGCSLYHAKITVKGLDFLTNDGGLSAILNVVTVKLHADTIRELIEAKVDASRATPEEKASLKVHLRRLSGAALQAAAKDLMKRGLDHVPDAIQWLQTHGVGL